MKVYKIEPGDTYWDIWRKIQEFNGQCKGNKVAYMVQWGKCQYTVMEGQG